MPAAASDWASASRLNCGLWRGGGGVRTATSISRPRAGGGCPTGAAAVRVEWPIVYSARFDMIDSESATAAGRARGSGRRRLIQEAAQTSERAGPALADALPGHGHPG